MKTPKRYLITAALPYANGLKHIGHLAVAYLPADIYVRYLKAQKRDREKQEWCEHNGIKYIPLPYNQESEWRNCIVNN